MVICEVNDGPTADLEIVEQATDLLLALGTSAWGASDFLNGLLSDDVVACCRFRRRIGLPSLTGLA